MDVGELVELRAASQIGVEAAGFDGKGSQSSGRRECFRFAGTRFGESIESGNDSAERWSRTGRNLLLNDSEGGQFRQIVTELRSTGDLAPARGALQSERNQFGDLLNDLIKRPGAVDVFEDAAAPALDVSQLGGFCGNMDPFTTRL